jgi:hypothetical protein
VIHYQLRCAESHEFDGWFKDSGNFEKQARRGLIVCPVCASTKVDRALMAPRVRTRGRTIEHEPEAVAPEPAADVPAVPAPVQARPAQAAGGVMPDQMRALLHKLRAEVEKNCDYVGPDFAKEARKIHNGEAAPRGIYGESTAAEAEELADDGIGVARIPWLPRADS